MSEEGRTIIQLKYILYSLSGFLLLIIVGVVVYRKSAASRLRVAELDVKVRELELTAIRAQMNPHFLYNALNSIQNLVQKEQLEEAHQYLSKFASLIRKVLKNSSKQEIALHEELEMIQEYVQLERLRFDFEFGVAITKDVDLYSVFLPPLLLQPIVENAIIHGLVRKEGERMLTIEITSDSSNICIFVKDNGIGRTAALNQSESSLGKGLQSSEERLRLVAEKYGAQYIFDVTDLEEDGKASGTLVKICFPVE